MRRYLLDTNIVSYLLKQGYPALRQRVRHIASPQLVISSITEAELRFGASLKPAEAKIHIALPAFLRQIDVHPWDSHCAQRYAVLASAQRRQGRPLSNFDTMIAAHALAHDFVLVSHDEAFQRIPELRIEDWTKGPQSA